jgi:capsular polysaccharide biosynthesis protein
MFKVIRRQIGLSSDELAALVLTMPEIFDEVYYRTRYSDIPEGYGAFDHFVHHGVHENRRPHLLFDPEFYRLTYGKFLKPGENLFAHYMTTGWKKGFNPHPYFNVNHYLSRYRDVRESGREPLTHYLREGWRQNHSPHPLFDTGFYADWYPDVLAAGMEPLQHYLNHGAAEGRKPNAGFEPKQYVKDHASEGVILSDALLHYFEHHFEHDKEAPNAELTALVLTMPEIFDEAYYRARYSDIPEGYGAFDHFVHHGVHENRRPHLLFDPEFYRLTYGKFLKPGENLFAHYMTTGWKKGFNPHPYFSVSHYLSRYREVRKSGMEPLTHYLREGWRQNHSPHPLFDTGFYTDLYPDVIAAGMEPLQHYLNHGAAEGRKPNALFEPKQYVKDHASEGVTLSDALLHYFEHDKDAVASLRSLSRLKLKPGVQRIDRWAETQGMKVMRFSTSATSTWAFPRIINRDRQGSPITGKLPSAYMAVLKNVKVIPGTRTVITSQHEMLHDELAEENALLYHPKIQSIGRFQGNECVSEIYASSMPRIREAILLSSDTDTNYFHFLVEALPKLWLVELAKLPLNIPILIQSGLHDNMIKALKRVAGGRKYIALPPNIAIDVRKLWFPSDLSRVLNNVESPVQVDYDIVVSQEAIRYVRGKMSVPAVKATRRIYVERASSYRLLTNEQELIHMLRANGFEIVNTARMTLEQQIEMFSQSQLVVAPTGAAMTNLMFCQSGSRALILVAETAQSNLNIFNHLGEAIGVEVSYCLGDRAFNRQDMFTVHDDFSIDVKAILGWCATHG